MSDVYHTKYLKYKNKYFMLKKQNAGAVVTWFYFGSDTDLKRICGTHEPIKCTSKPTKNDCVHSSCRPLIERKPTDGIETNKKLCLKILCMSLKEMKTSIALTGPIWMIKKGDVTITQMTTHAFPESKSFTHSSIINTLEDAHIALVQYMKDISSPMFDPNMNSIIEISINSYGSNIFINMMSEITAVQKKIDDARKILDDAHNLQLVQDKATYEKLSSSKRSTTYKKLSLDERREAEAIAFDAKKAADIKADQN